MYYIMVSLCLQDRGSTAIGGDGASADLLLINCDYFPRSITLHKYVTLLQYILAGHVFWFPTSYCDSVYLSFTTFINLIFYYCPGNMADNNLSNRYLLNKCHVTTTTTSLQEIHHYTLTLNRDDIIVWHGGEHSSLSLST